MQLLFESSEEGEVACLGLLPGRVRRLAGGPGLRIPHMGWNRLRLHPDAAASPLLAGIDEGDHAYFVHSYALLADGAGGACILAETDHGARFAAIIGSGRRYGAQFHPERSSALGLRLLDNFLKLPA
jgi:glutamine amidotransferase